MNPVVYGLPNCDTCRKARNWLARFEVAHDFVDYRANPVPAATLKDLGGAARWLGEAGQQVVHHLAQPAAATQEPRQ